jgi:hypothetical protein
VRRAGHDAPPTERADSGRGERSGSGRDPSDDPPEGSILLGKIRLAYFLPVIEEVLSLAPQPGMVPPSASPGSNGWGHNRTGR